MTATDEQLRFFKARAERLKDERDQLRSDVAYQGSTILMLTTEKAALERRIDELCAEVEALKRDEWAAGFNAGCDAVEAAYEDGKAHYEAENAELRRLATDMCACFRIGAEREGVSKQWCYELFDTYTRKLQELGIEVD